MVKLISILLAFCLISFENNTNTNDSNCTLSVEFSNIRNNEGKLFIFLYNYKNQYPDNPYKYFEIDKRIVKNQQLSFTIKNLKKGNYAISILDDENSNDDLDLFWGIPTEGYAFSNNIKPLLDLPNYEDLLFPLKFSNQRLKLDMVYIF